MKSFYKIMIEEAIQKKIFSSGSSEKTFIDKVLGREDIKRVADILKKDVLEKKDIHELLYVLNSAEAKLYNYSDEDRKTIGKFFVWLREVAVIYEHLYDYEKSVATKEKEDKMIIHDETSKKLIFDMKQKFTHSIFFMIDVFFFMSRSSLSVNAVGFKEILNNKFEIKYDTEPQQQKKSFFG